MSQTKGTQEEKNFVRQQIIHSEIPRDKLPYHTKFDELYKGYNDKFSPLSENDYWLLILRTGKQGNAKQLNPTKLPPMTATPAEKVEVLRLLPDSAGEREIGCHTPLRLTMLMICSKNTQKDDSIKMNFGDFC